ncbi:MAG: serine acetyltransferase [Microbacterium sp.]|uniref:serine acetyltransferase n=1 Tax=Microbacterium sp. TaxID=51671 RepID=UPI001AD399AC|nr:serine acetyltransferase [Microbacterium sp.]MBN9177786.1 serine acetyltransferase [Microbacterium sp.]
MTIAADMRSSRVSALTLRLAFTRPEVLFIVLLRWLEFADLASAGVLGRARRATVRTAFQIASIVLSFSIPPHVFGPGLSIAHYGTIVVNSKAQVGRNCRLHPGVTLGSTRDEAPVIGDEVFLGPGAAVFGAVTIGNRVHIGPGVVITRDVDDDMVVYPTKPLSRARTRPTWWREAVGSTHPASQFAQDS